MAASHRIIRVIGKFVNALPREYDIQKQMLEEREDGFSREVVVFLSAEAVRLIRVQAAAPQQAKVRGRSSLRGHRRG